mmetsp:Transcript_93/g.351  ORF Transcript_93/g.351 Transcript_93/m.351 type:complete len:87 (+) Transcript_93:849-1109(+)
MIFHLRSLPLDVPSPTNPLRILGMLTRCRHATHSFIRPVLVFIVLRDYPLRDGALYHSLSFRICRVHDAAARVVAFRCRLSRVVAH